MSRHNNSADERGSGSASADSPVEGRVAGKAALLRQLGRVLAIDRELVEAGARPAAARLLAGWQAGRLAATYADFRAEERYRDAVTFFLEDLYGPGDFSQRDSDLEKVLPIMSRVLPEAALAALTDALELHTLTMALDRAMLEVLTEELGMTRALDPPMWAEAYVRCDRRVERERQIALTVSAGRRLEQVVHKPLIYSLVRLARGPAKAAGFGALQDFVERGFKAFRSMQGAGAFIDAVAARETQLMESLFAGEVPNGWQQAPGTLTLEDLGE